MGCVVVLVKVGCTNVHYLCTYVSHCAMSFETTTYLRPQFISLQTTRAYAKGRLTLEKHVRVTLNMFHLHAFCQIGRVDPHKTRPIYLYISVQKRTQMCSQTAHNMHVKCIRAHIVHTLCTHNAYNTCKGGGVQFWGGVPCTHTCTYVYITVHTCTTHTP